MVEWEPISEAALRKRISQAEARMTAAQQRLWNCIRIRPQKWQQHPYGNQGNGFWAVGLIGQTVIWYNDIEDGFNRSRFTAYGTIDDYWCNQDELDITVQYVLIAIEHGSDLLQLMPDWSPKKR